MYLRNALSVGLVVALLAGVLCSFGGVQQGRTDKPAIDPAKPDTWEPAVARARKALRSLSEALILVAKDSAAPRGTRRKAIGLLGSIGDQKGLDFLISNVGVWIPKGPGWRPGRVVHYPCKDALCRGDWRSAQAILTSLKQKKTDADLVHLTFPLSQLLTAEVALAAVQYQLRQRPPEPQKKNLLLMKKYLLHEIQ